MRRDKINYYLDLAEVVSQRCTCLRRHYGAVIVKDDEVISTGYVGAPRGRENCTDLGYCLRAKLEIPRGERFELCRSVHAEANAIISASRRDMVCCSMCKRLVINAGIARVFVRDDKDRYRVIDVGDWVTDDEALRGELGY